MAVASAATNGSTKPTPPPSRMTLGALVKGRQEKPLRVLLYGVEGIGKSTFAANAPAPIFIGAEDGTSHLDVERFPMPQTWAEVFEAIRVLATETHGFKSVAFDTADWLEPLVWAHICARDGKKDVEDYGFGKGYVAALDEWRRFLAALEKLREAKGMHVLLLAHSWIKPFKNPEGDDFDRYELKLHNKAGGLMKEWSDVVLFANYETLAVKDDRTKRIKGVSDGVRRVYTSRTAAYDAKNRFDLPPALPLNWDDFFAAVKAHKPASTEVLLKAIRENAARLGGDIETYATDFLTKHGNDSAALAKLNDRLNAKVTELEN